MLKTLLAGSALASLLVLGAQAQQAPAQTEQTPPAATTSEEQAAPIVPETAGDVVGAPATDAAAPDAMAKEPAAPADTMAQQPAAPASPGALQLEEGWSSVDLGTVSADTLIGADIRTPDQDTIASVEDVLMTPDGQVENLVARFGGFLGFGETTVLLAPDEITVVKDADENVFVLTSLTPDALKDRPEYTLPQS